MTAKWGEWDCVEAWRFIKLFATAAERKPACDVKGEMIKVEKQSRPRHMNTYGCDYNGKRLKGTRTTWRTSSGIRRKRKDGETEQSVEVYGKRNQQEVEESEYK